MGVLTCHTTQYLLAHSRRALNVGKSGSLAHTYEINFTLICNVLIEIIYLCFKEKFCFVGFPDKTSSRNFPFSIFSQNILFDENFFIFLGLVIGYQKLSLQVSHSTGTIVSVWSKTLAKTGEAPRVETAIVISLFQVWIKYKITYIWLINNIDNDVMCVTVFCNLLVKCDIVSC